MRQPRLTVSRFDPATGHWEALADMPIELTGHRAVAVNGRST